MKYTLANNEPFQVDGTINETPKSVNVLDLKTSDLTNDSGFITGYTETDPIFQASAASSITSNDISNWNAKQDALVSGTNIKTVNNTSLLDSGNVSIPSLYWCTCPTEQATNGVKVINGVGIPTADGRPVPGTTIGVMFEADNTNSTPVDSKIWFNIDSTEAIPICYAGHTTSLPSTIALGGAGRVVYYTYKPGTDTNDPGVWMWTGHDVDKDTKYNFSTLKVPVIYSNGVYSTTTDNAWSTIESAIVAGRNVVLDFDADIYQLSYYDGGEAWFVYANDTSIRRFSVDYHDEFIHNSYSIRTSFYGTCATAAATSAKTSSIGDWQLKAGNVVSIKFTYNVPASATLNISSTGAKAIYYNGAAIKANIINAGNIATFVYDGSAYHIISVDEQATHPDNYYGICDTAASTVDKISTIEKWYLRKGSIAVIKFANNVPASATLNISSTGAKNIRYKGSNIIADIIAAGDTATFIYDGTYYQLISIDSPPSSDVELVSGVDVKTINNTSIVGPGNLNISATDPTTITDMTSSTTFSQAMAPNVVYIVGSASDPVTSFEITSLTSSSNYAEYYHAIIYCDDNMTFTRPSTIKVADDRSMPVFESGHAFEINIFENILTYTYTDLS